jgi:hypothetical protein
MEGKQKKAVLKRVKSESRSLYNVKPTKVKTSDKLYNRKKLKKNKY